MPTYIASVGRRDIEIFTIIDSELSNVLRIDDSVDEHSTDIFIDSKGGIYKYHDQKVEIVGTNEQISVPFGFNFQRNHIFFYDSDKRIKKMNLKTLNSTEFATPFNIKIDNIITNDIDIFFFNENNLSLNGKIKHFDFNIKSIVMSTKYAIVLDITNRIHLFDIFLFDIDLTITSFEDPITKIHASFLTNYAAITTSQHLTILDLDNKRMIKKLNIPIDDYDIHFMENNSMLIKSDKLTLYDLKTDKLITLLMHKKIVIAESRSEIEFTKKTKDECNLRLEIEDLKNIIIDMKIQYSRRIYLLEEKIKMLEDKELSKQM